MRSDRRQIREALIFRGNVTLCFLSLGFGLHVEGALFNSPAVYFTGFYVLNKGKGMMVGSWKEEFE